MFETFLFLYDVLWLKSTTLLFGGDPQTSWLDMTFLFLSSHILTNLGVPISPIKIFMAFLSSVVLIFSVFPIYFHIKLENTKSAITSLLMARMTSN